jgi:hypothetical protein
VLKRTARILLETYVGPETGRRVLEGAIRRGMGETIHAAIWLSDLRDFSGLSEALPRDEVIALLNDYFMRGLQGQIGGSSAPVEITLFAGEALASKGFRASYTLLWRAPSVRHLPFPAYGVQSPPMDRLRECGQSLRQRRGMRLSPRVPTRPRQSVPRSR